MQLSGCDVLMHQIANTKEEALAIVAHHLASLGLVGADYLAGLMAREAQSSTYLGSHIAIPHATADFKEKITKTGVAVVHFKEGVDWGNGDVVFVAVGIAANSDEHLTILKQLTYALTNEQDTALALQNATTANQIINALSSHTALPHTPSPNKVLLDTSSVVFFDGDTLEDMLICAAQHLNKQGVIPPYLFKHIFNAKVIELKPNIYCVAVQADIDHAKALIVHGLIHQQNNTLTVIVHPTNSPQEYQLNTLIDQLFALPTPVNDRQALLSALGLDGDQSQHYGQKYVYLANRHGLHARPATQLSTLASQWAGNVFVQIDSDQATKTQVSAKSLSRLLSLGVGYGQKLAILVEPLGQSSSDTDAAQAFANTITDAINAGLGEEVVPIYESNAQFLQSLKHSQDNIKTNHPSNEYNDNNATAQTDALVDNSAYFAIGASSGIAYAPAFVAKVAQFEYTKHADDSTAEKNKLKHAIDHAKQQLDNLIQHANNDEIAQIFATHKALLDDGAIMDEVYAQLDNKLSAAFAWHSQIDSMVTRQLSLDNHLLALRAFDVKDVGERVLAILCNSPIATKPSSPYILIKDDLMPSDVAHLDDKVVGILTAFGGASSHSAIVARALGIPAVVGAGENILTLTNETPILLDGQAGQFIINPNPHKVQLAQEQDTIQKRLIAAAHQHKNDPATTTDNHTISVMANLGDIASASLAVEQGADGVGLLRSEFVFMKHNKMPDMDTQMADYKHVFDRLGKRPVVVRTLDVGGDKPLPYLAIKEEDNPFLGVRGVRLTLRKPAIFRTQLTALVQASLYSSDNHDLRIMFPMIGRLEEWHKAKALLDSVLTDLPHPNIQAGMMIEVPSAAIMAEKFAPYVDFFSIGTNDLAQYTLAIDRGHPVLSSEADGLHPSVLRLINHTIKNAHKYGKWVGLCGELGADKVAIPILLGLGVDELSVSVSQIPTIKSHIRTLNKNACKALALQALECQSADDVRMLSQRFIDEHTQPNTQG